MRSRRAKQMRFLEDQSLPCPSAEILEGRPLPFSSAQIQSQISRRGRRNRGQISTRAASRDEIRSRGAKRPRTIGEPPRPCSSMKKIQSRRVNPREPQLQVCSTASWGAKRVRTVRRAPLALSRCRRKGWYVHTLHLRQNFVISPIDSNPVSVPGWRDWANLDDGPAGLIAERVLANDVADYIRFRAVCRPWRQCSADPREHNSLDRRFHPRRWFMLREKPPATAPYRRRFVNVSTGHWVDMDLPELKGHCAFGPIAEGLLVLVDQRSLVVRLLNPFTRQLTVFPSVARLLRRKKTKKSYSRDLVVGNLSVKAAGLAGEGTIALSFAGNMLAVAKAGDESWALVNRGTLFFSCISFAGRFYCISANSIMMVKTTESKPPQLVVVAKLYSPCSLISADTMHLVQNAGEMIMVHRYLSSSKRKYDAYRVDLDAGKTIPVLSLNGNAVFIGQFRALSVSPTVFPSIIADAIYPGFEFAEKTRGQHKMEAYRLDGSVEPSASSYDVLSGLNIAQPYRIADFLSLNIGGYLHLG